MNIKELKEPEPILQNETVDLLDSMLWDPNNYPIDVFAKHNILINLPSFNILSEGELKAISDEGSSARRLEVQTKEFFFKIVSACLDLWQYFECHNQQFYYKQNATGN